MVIQGDRMKDKIIYNNYKIYMRPPSSFPTFTNTSLWTEYLSFRDTFLEVGSCEIKPSITTSESSSVTLASGSKKILSQKVVMNIGVLKVTAENYNYLESLNRADIIFEEVHSGKTWILKAFPVNVFLKIKGDDFDTIKVTGERTVINPSDILTIKDNWIMNLELLESSISSHSRDIDINVGEITLEFNNQLTNDLDSDNPLIINFSPLDQSVNFINRIEKNKLIITLPPLENYTDYTIYARNIKDSSGQLISIEIPFKTKPPKLMLTASNLSVYFPIDSDIYGKMNNDVKNVESIITESITGEKIRFDRNRIEGQEIWLTPEKTLEKDKKYFLNSTVTDVYSQKIVIKGYFSTLEPKGE